MYLDYRLYDYISDIRSEELNEAVDDHTVS